MELAKQHVPDLSDASVVVIGAGKMGRTAAKRLRAEGAQHIYVTNRTIKRAQDVIAEIGQGQAVEMPGLTDAIASADLVVTSTGASHFILTPQNVGEAMQQRPGRPLVIVDIAVPRDADPAVAQIAGVRLIDIDGLKGVVDATLQARREAIPHVEEIIDEYIERFGHWYQSRTAVPVIASLTQKAELIRKREMERLFARCPELTERERMLITGSSLTIISKLLHNVVTKIRDKAVSNHAEALSHARILDELFDLQISDQVPAPAMPDLLDAEE